MTTKQKSGQIISSQIVEAQNGCKEDWFHMGGQFRIDRYRNGDIGWDKSGRGELADTVVRVCGAVELVSLPVFVFSTVKKVKSRK